MKRIVVILAVIVAAGIAVYLLADRSPPPASSLRLLGTKVVDGHTYYELQIDNPLDHPVTYWGYDAGSPAFEVEYWRGGEWEFDQASRCGTGLTLQSLAPHASRTILVYPLPDVAVRVGIDLNEPKYVNFGRPLSKTWLPDIVQNWYDDWQLKREIRKWRNSLAWSEPLQPVSNPPGDNTVIFGTADPATDPFASPPTTTVAKPDTSPDVASPTVADPFAPLIPPATPGSDPFAPSRSP